MPSNLKDLLAPLGDMKLDFRPLYKAADTGFMALSRGPKRGEVLVCANFVCGGCKWGGCVNPHLSDKQLESASPGHATWMEKQLRPGVEALTNGAGKKKAKKEGEGGTTLDP